jgi:hypothetical protein
MAEKGRRVRNGEINAAGAALALALLIASPLLAQRTLSVTYDETRQVKIEGPITRIEWVNPRAFVFVDVKDAGGSVMNWAVDIGNPLELEAGGWPRSTLHVGDVISVEGTPARGTERQARGDTIVAKSTGKRLFVVTPRRAAPASAPAPRRADGHVRLGAQPGKSGYWGHPSATVLVDRNAGKIAMSPEGLLVNLSDADRVAPFQPWAKALYLYRQRTLLKDDPAQRCLPPGGPRQFQSENGFQFVEQPEIGRILLMLGGGDRNWRVIYTDGRPPGQAAEVVPAYYGTSVGRWDGDALVVDTVGFNERFWMSAGGLPHTEALHLTERFTRPDTNTLRYDVTIDDPRTYTRPWSGGWTLQWIADRDLQEYFCEENAESTFIR